MTTRDDGAEAGPVHIRGTVLTVRRVDAYYAMTVVAPGIAARFVLLDAAGIPGVSVVSVDDR